MGDDPKLALMDREVPKAMTNRMKTKLTYLRIHSLLLLFAFSIDCRLLGARRLREVGAGASVCFIFRAKLGKNRQTRKSSPPQFHPTPIVCPCPAPCPVSSVAGMAQNIAFSIYASFRNRHGQEVCGYVTNTTASNILISHPQPLCGCGMAFLFSGSFPASLCLPTSCHLCLFRDNCHRLSCQLSRTIVTIATDYRDNCHECCLTRQTGVLSYRLNFCSPFKAGSKN